MGPRRRMAPGPSKFLRSLGRLRALLVSREHVGCETAALPRMDHSAVRQPVVPELTKHRVLARLTLDCCLFVRSAQEARRVVGLSAGNRCLATVAAPTPQLACKLWVRLIERHVVQDAFPIESVHFRPLGCTMPSSSTTRVS